MSSKQFWQMFFSLKFRTFSAFPQKMQAGSYFLRMILSPST